MVQNAEATISYGSTSTSYHQKSSHKNFSSLLSSAYPPRGFFHVAWSVKSSLPESVLHHSQQPCHMASNAMILETMCRQCFCLLFLFHLVAEAILTSIVLCNLIHCSINIGHSPSNDLGYRLFENKQNRRGDESLENIGLMQSNAIGMVKREMKISCMNLWLLHFAYWPQLVFVDTCFP